VSVAAGACASAIVVYLLTTYSALDPTCQALVLKEQPYGKAVLRLTAERKKAQEQLGPLEVRARLLEAGWKATLSSQAATLCISGAGAAA
jgi:hypothetical protein